MICTSCRGLRVFRLWITSRAAKPPALLCVGGESPECPGPTRVMGRGERLFFTPGGCTAATIQQPRRFSNFFHRFPDRGIFFTAEAGRGWANLVFETFRGWGWVRATPSHPHTPATCAAQARTGEGSRQNTEQKPSLILRFSYTFPPSDPAQMQELKHRCTPCGYYTPAVQIAKGRFCFFYIPVREVNTHHQGKRIISWRFYEVFRDFVLLLEILPFPL